MLNSIANNNITIIGAGKLGKALALDIKSNNIANITAIINSTVNSSQKLAEEFNIKKTYEKINQLPASDFIFITTPDDIISKCVNELMHNINIKAKTIIVHCSGVLSSEILSALKSKGCQVASLHPMRSFSQSAGSSFTKAYCALEGDSEAVNKIQTLMAPLEINWLTINSSKKVTYHSGGVFSANYLIAVLHQAQQAYQEAGISKKQALDVTCDLAQNVLNNIKRNKSLEHSLTGPLARGDLETLKLHLSNMQPNTQVLYKNLALELLDLCNLKEEKQMQIKALLRLDNT